MITPILRTAIWLLMPLFIFLSLYLLFRGHNEPGGGFIGGLIAAIGFVFHALAYDSDTTLRVFKLNPTMLISLGLLIALSSGIIAMFFGYPFMKALWADFYLPVIGRPGTPLMFDLGVYLVVIGIVLKITFTMSRL